MEEKAPVSKHKLKELKKLQRKEERTETSAHAHASKSKKKLLLVLTLLISCAALFLFAIHWATSERFREGPYTAEAVHWHAKLFVEKCGIPLELPKPQGEHHVGLPLLHTHKDQLIHIEGKIWKINDILLGAYLTAIGIDDDVLTENEQCNSVPAHWKMTVNGKENNEFASYVIHDGDEIKLSLLPLR